MTLTLLLLSRAWAGPAEAWLAAPDDGAARLAFAVELASAPATHVEGLVALERLRTDAVVGCAAQAALLRAGPPEWVGAAGACPTAPRGPAGAPPRYPQLGPDEQLRHLRADLLTTDDATAWDALADELGVAWGRAAEVAKASANQTLGGAQPPIAEWPPEGARLHAAARRGWMVALSLRPHQGSDYGGLGGLLWDEQRLPEAWSWFEAGARRSPQDPALAQALVDLVAFGGLSDEVVAAHMGLPAEAAEALPSAVRRLREEGVDPGLISRTMLQVVRPPVQGDVAELARAVARSSLPRALWRWDPTGLYPEPAVFVDTSASVLAPAIQPIAALSRDPAMQAASTSPPTLDPSADLLQLAQLLTPLPATKEDEGRIGRARDLCLSMRGRWPHDRPVATACADLGLIHGLLSVRAGDLDRGAEELSAAVAASPLSRDELWHRVDPAFLERMTVGDLAAAEALLRPFVTPGLSGAPQVADRSGWLHLVRAQRYEGDDDARLADFAAALATHPTPALIGLHGLYARHGDVDMAIACLVELVERPTDDGDPQSGEVARERLVVYLARVGRPAEGRSYARTDALRVRLNEELAWASLVGDARRAHGAPPDPSLIRRLEAADASTLDRLALRGGAWLDLGQLDAAWADLSRLAAEGGDPAGAFAAARRRGLAAVDLSGLPEGDVSFLRQLEGAGAAAFARGALKGPLSPQRLVWLGDALAQAGEVKRARKAYTRALSLSPQTVEATIGLAWLELGAGDGPAAERRLAEASARFDHPAYVLARSDLLIALGRAAEAQALRATLPDLLEVADPRVPLLPRVPLPSGRAPLGPPP